MHHPKLEELVRSDSRYSYEAYEFVFAALTFTQKRLGRLPREEAPADLKSHVGCRELLDGIRELALREFGFMARTVFKVWGINSTADWGEIVFGLIEAKLMSKTAEDDRSDFHDVFDLDDALVRNFRIEPITDEGEG
jgi:uncharacterized repeat protein (TIGR04138 family)